MINKQLEILDICKRGSISSEVLANLPGFLIIGVAKGGITSLFENLSFHPRLCRPKNKHILNQDDVMNKELRFFWLSKNYKQGPEYYASLFPSRQGDEIFFEATTAYIWIPCQKRIQALLPDVKAILLLRNPTNRAWSHYWTFFSRPPYDLPLSCLKNINHQIIQRGIYIDQIRRWHEYFPKENLLILKSEDYFRNECEVLNNIFEFLGVKKIEIKNISKRDPWEMMKQERGYPAIPPDIKRWLDEFYWPHNEALSEYLFLCKQGESK